MADAIISMLLQRLASATYRYVVGEVRLILNVKKEVEDFTSNLKDIEAVLEDAEQRQVKEASVRHWLDKLKEISYEMGDELDEWNTEVLKQEVDKQEREGDQNVIVPKKKVCFSISSRCSCFGRVSQGRVIFRHDIALRIKDLSDRLTVIAKQREMYNFQHTQRVIQQPQRQKTSSFVDMSKIFGREIEKDMLVKRLLSDSSEDGREPFIIPIVGMGGMGKTTLAQLAYNDDNVKARFERRIWLCVSDPFDEIKIAKAICGHETPSSNELDYVLQCMSKSIEGKRFILVLDDVWIEDSKKWDSLKLPRMQSGAKGSRILVTTRKQKVAGMMRATTQMINFRELSEQNCLSIFDDMTFFDREVDESNFFGDISKEIVKKC